MRTTRSGCRLWIPAAVLALAGGCGLDVTGVGSDVGEDPGSEGFDGEVPPPDDAGDDASDDAADDAEAATCTTAGECDDGIACTVDDCATESGLCTHEPDDAACDDGDACNGAELCDPARGCVSGTPVDCDDEIGCTDDLCDPTSGGCLRALVHERCTPPQLCDPPRSADAAGCADPPACEIDGDCADDDLCNGNETCGPDRLCRPGTPVVCDDGVTCTIDSCRPATGTCEHVGPDADGDTYIDAACFGTDCDDTRPEVHPGAPELCNSRDDDCDGTIDVGATCAPLPNATVACVGGACVLTCLDGWGDCDGTPSNGCESSFSDPATCGSCTTPCTRQHAVPSCAGGICGVASCDPGWGDCNLLESDGCERPLNTLSDCGTCFVACAPANAAGADCSDGTCGYASCNAGWLDCDGHPENGCELSVGTPTSCGTSCATVSDCTTLPHVASATCTGGGCSIGACANGYAECNDRPDDGCERLLDNNVGTCAGAVSLGSVWGDTGSGVLTRTGFGEGWFSFRVNEYYLTSGYYPLTARIQLDVPAGIDYEVFAHCGGSGCSSTGPSGQNAAGVDESVNIRWDDASGDTGRTVYFDIRFYGGSTLGCGNWTVTITGNTSVSSATCP